MDWQTIKKSDIWVAKPNLLSYEATRASFSWEQILADLNGLPAGKGLNIAHEAVDRHANGPHRSHVAIRWIGKNDIVDYLAARTN